MTKQQEALTLIIVRERVQALERNLFHMLMEVPISGNFNFGKFMGLISARNGLMKSFPEFFEGMLIDLDGIFKYEVKVSENEKLNKPS